MQKSTVDNLWDWNIKLHPADWVICEGVWQQMSSGEHRCCWGEFWVKCIHVDMHLCCTSSGDSLDCVLLHGCLCARQISLPHRQGYWLSTHFKEHFWCGTTPVYLAAFSGWDFSWVTISKRRQSQCILFFRAATQGSMRLNLNDLGTCSEYVHKYIFFLLFFDRELRNLKSK